MRALFSAFNSGVARVISALLDMLYIKGLERYVTRETVRYVGCGVMNYIVLDAIIYYTIYHYIIRLNYIYLGSMVISPHVASLIITFPITFFTGFWLNRYVAFQSTERRVEGQLFRYALSVGGSIVLSYVSLKLLVESFGVWATPAKVMSSIITSLYSYLMARFYTFRRR